MSSPKDENCQKTPLQRTEAEHRKTQIISSKGEYTVDYKLILNLRQSKDKNPLYPDGNFEGRLHLSFTYNDPKQEDIFLNFCGKVHSITVNSKPTTINFKNCRITLSHADLICNSTNEVVILYEGNYDTSGTGLHHFIDPIDSKEYLYSQFEPFGCNLVFPVFDQPDIKATLQTTICGPYDWVKLANEAEVCSWFLTENTKESCTDIPVLNNLFSSLTQDEYEFLFKAIYDKHYTISIFEKTPRIASYLFAFCAGPYRCLNNPYAYKVPIRIFMRDSLKFCGDPKEFFRVIACGMEWYKKFFGEPFPFNKYDQIFCPEYNYGAMENVGWVTYNEAYCRNEKPTQQFRSRFSNTVLHELAHMWFGNWVTMTWWDDLWLNESFATFISFLCQEQACGDTYKNTWVSFNNLKGNAYHQDQQSTTHPVFGDITDTDKSESHFDGIVYYKGSSWLKQMFYFIGEENFSNGLKEYFKAYRWGNTKFDDFVSKMAEQLKRADNSYNAEYKFDLASLSKKWLTESGLNSIVCNWENDGDKIKKFVLTQKACLPEHNNIQCHLFEILFIYSDSSRNIVKKIMIEPKEESIIKEFEGLPSPQAVILNYNDWGYFKFIIDKTSLSFLKTDLITKLPDLLTRQMFYRSLFDMTRDAELSSKEYLDIIKDLLINETDDELISNAMRKLPAVVRDYLPPKYHEEYMDKMYILNMKLLIKHINNEQMVLVLLEFITSFARGDNRLNELKAWLDVPEGQDIPLEIEGEKALLNFKSLNQDNRFSICHLIFTSSNITKEVKDALLKKEIERDGNSDKSHRMECTCKASLPDMKVKEEMWDLFVNKPESDSLYNMKAFMEGFRPLSQIDLVKDFVTEKFIEDIYKIAKQGSFYIKAFVMYCGPVYNLNEEMIAKVEQKAKGCTMSEILQRSLIEWADDMKRFKKAQDLVLKN